MKNKNRVTYLAAALPGLCLFATAVSAQTTVFDLGSAVISGVGQNVFAASTTNSASAKAGTLSTVSNDLVFTNSDSSGAAYLLADFSNSVNLVNVGDTLTLTYTVTATNEANAAESLRIGLFNVGSATDGGDAGKAAFKYATGYRVDYGKSSAGNGIRSRAASAGYPNLMTDGPYARLTDATTAPSSYFTQSFNASGSVTFSGSIILTLVAANQIQVTSVVGTGSQAYVIDTSPNTTTFNAAAFYTTAGGAGNTLDFSALNVSYASAIPEPATAALLAGVMAFVMGGGCLLRRHRRVAGE